jgi:hypothetical protein
MRQRRTFPEVLTCGNRAKRVCVYPPSRLLRRPPHFRGISQTHRPRNAFLSLNGACFSVTSGDEFRCVSAAFILCCLSTESGTVAVAQYRSMLGIREQSAPTDAPTPSGLIARRWNEEVREGEDHRRGSCLSTAPMAKRHTADCQVFVIAGHRDRRGRSGAARYPRVRRKSRRLARPGRSPRTRRPCQ